MDREERDTLERSKWVTELLGKNVNVNLKLDEQDIVNAKWSREKINDTLTLFDEITRLFIDTIENSSRFTHESNAQIAHSILTIRAFNDLRAAYKLLINGYYIQMFPLLRCSFESSSRMRYFLRNQTKATSWLSGKEIPEREIRKKLHDKDILKEIYSEYSGYSHVNVKATIMYAFDTELDKVKVFSIGGNQDERWLKTLSNELIVNAVFALTIASKPYKESLSKEWKERFSSVLTAFIELVSHSQEEKS